MSVENFSGIIQNIFYVLAASWWIDLPLILLPVFLNSWLMSIRFKFIIKMKWKLLEIKIPKEILRSPKAMEQVFSTMYNMYDKRNFVDTWWKGELQEWASFEMMSHDGRIHFYVRIIEKYRNMVESAIYAQYPDVEIAEVDDYTSMVPSVLPNKTYNVWGANFVLAKESGYPIRTYDYFEELVKEKRLDPIAVLTEGLSKTKNDEIVWLQFLIRPVGDGWKKEAEKLVGKLIGRKEGKEKTLLEYLEEFFRNLVKAPFIHPVWSEDEGSEGSKGELGSLTPGERDVVKAIETKIAKVGFETVIKFLYIDKREGYNLQIIPTILGGFRQFNSQNLNSFKIESKTVTKTKFPFKAQKLYTRQRRFFESCIFRMFPMMSKLPVLNTEELATIFHFPTTFVEAPTLHRIDSKRGEPPAELPIAE